MHSESAESKPSVAVVGVGYWGKNLVRNFFELGALRTVCDGNPLVEANVKAKYPLLACCRRVSRMACVGWPNTWMRTVASSCNGLLPSAPT